MSEQTVVTLAGMVIGFLTLWLKQHYGRKQSDKRVGEVETKIDANTLMTAQVVEQTNGLPTLLRAEIDHLKSEVKDLKTSLRQARRDG